MPFNTMHIISTLTPSNLICSCNLFPELYAHVPIGLTDLST